MYIGTRSNIKTYRLVKFLSTFSYFSDLSQFHPRWWCGHRARSESTSNNTCRHNCMQLMALRKAQVY